MENCLFCKISTNKINSQKKFENDEIIAFDDINPKAPVHILIIPKKHINSVAELSDVDQKLAGKLILTARDLAKTAGLEENGYRLVFNTKTHAGQIVDHIHLHLLGGKQLGKMV